MTVRRRRRSRHNAVVAGCGEVQSRLACLVVALGPRRFECQALQHCLKRLGETAQVVRRLRSKVPGIRVARIDFRCPLEINQRLLLMVKLKVAEAGEVPRGEKRRI